MKKIIIPMLIVMSLVFIVSASGNTLFETEITGGESIICDAHDEYCFHDNEVVSIDTPEGIPLQTVEFDYGSIEVYDESTDEMLADLIAFLNENPIALEESDTVQTQTAHGTEQIAPYADIHAIGSVYTYIYDVQHSASNDTSQCKSYRTPCYYCSLHSDCYIIGTRVLTGTCPGNHPYQVR